MFLAVQVATEHSRGMHGEESSPETAAARNNIKTLWSGSSRSFMMPYWKLSQLLAPWYIFGPLLPEGSKLCGAVLVDDL